MENLYGRIRNFKLPKKNEIERAISSFSKREWLVFYALAFVLLLSTVLILQNINKSFMVSVPMKGGVISEGIIGTPRFINPVLAYSDVDRDLVSLIYSGLMRKNPDGVLVPDLAEIYEVSEDGLTYTFTLKDKIYFQDDQPVTASDVMFTINKIKDSTIKSPRKANWDGVSATVIDNKNIKFTLKRPYASFLENTTLGILPEHLWNETPLELNDLNTNPVGTGPYMIKSVSKKTSGIVDYYELRPFNKFALGKPHIQKLWLRFYPNEEDLLMALDNEIVDQVSSITPLNAKILKEKGYVVESTVLPRIFGLFFNQNQNQIFTNKTVVRAIDLAIDKNRIVREVLGGYGVAIGSPIPPAMILDQVVSEESNTSHEDKVAAAAASLAKDGWKKGEDGFLTKTTTSKDKKTTTSGLQFSISTGNAPELSRAAELIQEDLAAIGIKVEVKTFEAGNLNQSVIRSRKYDALLFGQIINNESDLFAFWHSTQRNDPGLNVAMYTNAKVDKILEDAFVTVNPEARAKKYAEFESEIKKDMPAVFLYSPKFIYIVSGKLNGSSINHITFPGDRFSGVYLWYSETDDIWKIFSKNK